MQKFAAAACLALFMTVFPISTDPSVYYVDGGSGRDSNSGLTPKAAWRTLARVNRAMNRIQPGDAVLFKRGGWFRDRDLIIRTSGEPGRPVLFGAYGAGENPVFESIQVLGRDPDIRHVEICDLHIIGADTGIGFFGGRAAHIAVRRCTVDLSRNNGIFLSGIDSYTVEGCSILNSRNSGIVVYGSKKTPAQNGVIRANRVDGCRNNDGITLHMSDEDPQYAIGRNHLIEKNVCSNCREQGIDLTSGSQIVLRGNETFSNGDSSLLIGNVEDVSVENHFSHDELNTGVLIGRVSRLTFSGSVVHNAHRRAVSVQPVTWARGIEFLNNTLIAGPDSTGELLSINVRSHDLVFRNNVFCSINETFDGPLLRFVEGATPLKTAARFSHNIWWRSASGARSGRLWWDERHGFMDFQNWSALGQGKGSLLSDPKLSDPEQHEFGLIQGSPGIDAGVDVGLRTDFAGTEIPQGKCPDIGALEYTVRKKVRKMRPVLN